MDILIFILVCYGLTQGLVHSPYIPKPDGIIGDMLSCSMCTGFWVGWLIWLLSFGTALVAFSVSPVTGFFLACLSSGTSYFLDSLSSD